MRHILSLIMAYLLCIQSVWGAACTASVQGSWTAAATWGGTCAGSGTNGTPAIGDTFTINAAVTVDSDVTVGTSPVSGTAVGTIGAAGSITIAEGQTFYLRGGITHANASALRCVINVVGGKLRFDPTASADRTTTTYTIGPSGSLQPNSKICSAAGAGGTRAEISTYRPNGDEARSYFSLNGFNTRIGLFDFADTDFLDLGAAATNMATVYLGSGDGLTLARNTFTRTGVFGAALSYNAAANVTIEDNTWASSLGTQSIEIYSQSAPSGTRVFRGNVLDKRVKTGFWLGFTVEYNVMTDRWVEAANSGPATFAYNVVNKTDATGSTALYGASYANSLMLENAGAASQGYSLDRNGDQTLERMVFQRRAGPTSDTESVIGGTVGGTKTLNRILVLPQSDSGTGLSADYTSGPVFVGIAATTRPYLITHMTYKGQDFASFQVPLWFNHPLFSTPSDTVTTYKYNLYWDSSARGNHMMWTQAPANNDMASPAGIDWNACYNCLMSAEAGSTGKPYSIPMTTSSFAANDLNSVNPRLVDTDRNFEGFATQFGQARSAANTLTLLSAAPRTRIPLLLSYIESGAVPQNPAMWNRDSTYIGAVDPAPLRRAAGALSVMQ